MTTETIRTEQFPVRLTKRDKALLRKLATQDARSMNDIVILALEKYASSQKVSVVKRGKKWV